MTVLGRPAQPTTANYPVNAIPADNLPLSAPINTVAPVVTGVGALDGLLTTATGSWDALPAITSYAYQWQRDGVDIAGATAGSYTLTALDVLTTVRVEVTATNRVGATTAFSNGINII